MARTRVTRGTGLLEGFLARQRAKVVNALIPNSHRSGCILDIGCGSFPLFLTQTRFSRKIGIDRVMERTPAEGTSHDDILFIHHDLELDSSLPIASHSCTVVTMLAVIEHIEYDVAIPLITDVRRVLEPGGIFILTTPAAWTDVVLRAMATVRLVSPVEVSEHKAAYDRAQLRSMLGDVFPAEDVRTGTFELGINLWACARKPIQGN